MVWNVNDREEFLDYVYLLVTQDRTVLDEEFLVKLENLLKARR